MKTEQEQIEEIVKIILEASNKCLDADCDYCVEQYEKDCAQYRKAVALVQAGYGGVSEYKAEIERLRQEVRDTDKMARNTIEQYRAENEELENALKQSEDNYSRAFERLKAQGREIEKLKAGTKQAQIDVLNKVKDIVFDYLGVKNIKEAEALSLLDSTLTYDVVTCGIDEIIKEIENE